VKRSAAKPKVLIIVQNLPLPFDRRVWLECQALHQAGYQVSAVCPKADGDPTYEVLEGISLYRYKPYAPGGSAAGFVGEYAYSFAATARMVARARRREGPFDVVQACNPPDIFWPIGRALRRMDGTRFVFDHHDLCPELYDSRFPERSRLPRRGLVALERATFHAADHVISTNESYAAVAAERGGVTPDRSSIVRTGPDPERLRRGAPVPERLRGRRHLVAYIGVMGPQDGVDVAVRAAGHVVHDFGRRDISFTFMGGGDSYDELVALRDELGLGDYVELPGRVPDSTVTEVLSTADLGLSADPSNPLNDVSTMNKTMEYMAYSVPVLAFDLKETKVSAGEAAYYVTEQSPMAYAEAMVELLDDPARRATMAGIGRRRVEEVLGWPHQQSTYVSVYDRLVGRDGSPSGTGTTGVQPPRSVPEPGDGPTNTTERPSATTPR